MVDILNRLDKINTAWKKLYYDMDKTTPAWKKQIEPIISSDFPDFA